MPAGALAKAAQLPRNRLYEILEELQGMGLIEILMEETRKYRAKPITDYLDRAVADLRGRMEKLEAEKPLLDAAFQPAPITEAEDLESGTTRVILTRRAVAREIDRMVESGPSSFVAAGSVGGSERMLRHVARLPATTPFDAVEIYLPRAIAAGVESLAEGWRHAIRWTDVPLRAQIYVANHEEMLLVHGVPDDDKLRVGRDFALLTSNAAFIRDHVELLRASCAPETRAATRLAG